MDKILVVSQTEKSAQAMIDLAKKAGENAQFSFAVSSANARRMVLDETFDLVLINTPLLDDDGIEFAIMVTTNTEAQAIVFVKEEYFADASLKAKNSGVLLVSKPIVMQYLVQVLSLSEWIKARIRSLKSENYKLQIKLEDSKIICKAKCLLVAERHCTEEEAHHLMEKTAMNRRLTLKEVASLIIRRNQD